MCFPLVWPQILNLDLRPSHNLRSPHTWTHSLNAQHKTRWQVWTGATASRGAPLFVVFHWTTRQCEDHKSECVTASRELCRGRRHKHRMSSMYETSVRFTFLTHAQTVRRQLFGLHAKCLYRKSASNPHGLWKFMSRALKLTRVAESVNQLLDQGESTGLLLQHLHLVICQILLSNITYKWSTKQAKKLSQGQDNLFGEIQ